MPKILIFDAEPMLGEMYLTKFRLNGFEAKYFDHPPENVVEVVAREKPDIISMDILMKQMDGFTAMKLLKGDSRTLDIPLFFLTNLGQQEDIEKGKSLGAVDYLVKANVMPQEVVNHTLGILGLPTLPPKTIPQPKAIPPRSEAPHRASIQERPKQEPIPGRAKPIRGLGNVRVPLWAFVLMLVWASFGLLLFFVLLAV